LDRESQIHARLHDVYAGLEWRLCRDPDSGYLVDDAYWVVTIYGDALRRVPGLTVLYTFDADTVEVLRILVKAVPQVSAR
jgi:hypothetical protein